MLCLRSQPYAMLPAVFFCGGGGADPGFVVSRKRSGGFKSAVLYDCTIAEWLEVKTSGTPLTEPSSFLVDPQCKFSL